MKSLGLGRYALCSCVAAALLAGCGGSQPPIAMPNLLQKNFPIGEIVQTQSLRPTYKVSEPLLYVASFDETLTPLRIYKARGDYRSRWPG